MTSQRQCHGHFTDLTKILWRHRRHYTDFTGRVVFFVTRNSSSSVKLTEISNKNTAAIILVRGKQKKPKKNLTVSLLDVDRCGERF